MKLSTLSVSVLWIGALVVEISAQASIARASRCSRDDHQKCIALADPLLKDPHLIFPDNMKDIDMVCRTWSGFVDCIKRYIDNCFSKRRQEQFNSAVEIPIASVHQMCSVSTYQSEYLQYASCLKETVIDAKHCGNEYAALVDEVSKGEMARTGLCCSHYHFRSCVIFETKKKCDGNQSNGAASRFSRQVLDKALSFLQDQCQNYIPNNADCPNSVTDTTMSLAVTPIDESRLNLRESKGRTYLRTLSPDNYAVQASNLHGTSANTMHPSPFRSTGRSYISFSTLETEEDGLDEKQSSTRITTVIEDKKISTPEPPSQSSASFPPSLPPSSSSTSSSISSSTSSSTSPSISSPSSFQVSTETDEKITVEDTNRVSIESNEEPAIVVTQRPLNYGRGMSWTSPSTKPSTEIPAWATSTWLTSNQVPVTDESWYPAAGSFGGNHIDEPNQQGLSKNGQASLRIELLCVGILSIAVYLF